MTDQQQTAVNRMRERTGRPDGVQVLDDQPDDGQHQNVTAILPWLRLYLTWDWAGNLIKTETEAQRKLGEEPGTPSADKKQDWGQRIYGANYDDTR